MPADTPCTSPCAHHLGHYGHIGQEPELSGADAPCCLLQMTVNGRPVSLYVDPAARLLDIIRDDLQLTGTKEGCGVGECGACTVILEDRAVLSCMTPALSAQGLRVTTIEGVAQGGQLHPVQTAFIKHAALQCGFCTPAMVLVAVNLLETQPDADRECIRLAMSGTLCRCTGYEQILDAVEDARDILRARRQSAEASRTGKD